MKTLYQSIQGTTYGRLTILNIELVKGKGTMAMCQCFCGNAHTVRLSSLLNRHTRSCGCFQKDRVKETVTKHGHNGKSRSTEYRTWDCMLQRCYNTKVPFYHNYGGRGIQVCQRWRSDFRNFLADMGLKPSSKYTLDRINNDGDYEPSNCRWATWQEQHANKRARTHESYLRKDKRDGVIE